uniref:Uncharacterized protein n=1 Tax=Anopheles merus TaxID=30066 RepID=A0A182V3E0_ANOME
MKGVNAYSGCHNAYSGCQKCTIVGLLDGHRMYFAYDAERQPRNHSDFGDDKFPSHVNKRTPLTRLLGCDIVADFVSAEDMHLLYKGVEAKLIDLWINGFSGLPCYLPRRQQHQRHLNTNVASSTSSFTCFSRLSICLDVMLQCGQLTQFLIYYLSLNFLSKSFSSSSDRIGCSVKSSGTERKLPSSSLHRVCCIRFTTASNTAVVFRTTATSFSKDSFCAVKTSKWRFMSAACLADWLAFSVINRYKSETVAESTGTNGATVRDAVKSAVGVAVKTVVARAAVEAVVVRVAVGAAVRVTMGVAVRVTVGAAARITIGAAVRVTMGAAVRITMGSVMARAAVEAGCCNRDRYNGAPYLIPSAVMTVGRLVDGRTYWFGTAKVPRLEVVLPETEAAVVLVMVVVVVVANVGQSASSSGSTGPVMKIFLSELIVC